MGLLLVMVSASAMALLVTASLMELLVTPLLTQLPMPLLRSTPTRSPPTPTSMPWLTTTLEPVLTPRSLMMAPLPGKEATLSTFLTEGSSMSTTEPTMLKATSPRSPMTARLSSLMLLPPLLLTLLPVLLLPMPLLVPLLPPSATWAKRHSADIWTYDLNIYFN